VKIDLALLGGTTDPMVRGIDAFTFHVFQPEAQPTDDAPAGDDDTDKLPAVVTDDDLDRVLRDYLGVTLPKVKCCEGHSTPWDAVHEAFFARTPISVWKGSRGLAGKTFSLATLGLAEALFLRADVNILGGSGVQSQRVLESIGKMWDHPTAPKRFLKGSQPGSQVQKMVWGNRILALMASQKSVRGPHPQRLRLDEVDEIAIDILNAALGQPMSKAWVLSQIVLSSTHQYANGTMTDVLKRAAAGGWPVHEWCYRETLEPHGWLTVGEVERKRAVMTAGDWQTEVELQEPSSEGRAMDTAKVEAAFQAMILMRIPDGDGDNGYSRAVLEPPVPGARYGTGGDWAKKKNHTVIVTIRHDVVPARVVCITRVNKRPWPEMIGFFDAQVKDYGGTAVHDNTGLGQVVHDLLTVHAEAFDMVGRQRAELLSEYMASIEHGEIVWPRSDTNKALKAAHGEHKFATREDIYKGSKDASTKHHLPDTISAAAFAWRAAGGVVAASSVKQPDPADAPHLQAGVQHGRLSGYIAGRVNQLPGMSNSLDGEGPTGLHQTRPDTEGKPAAADLSAVAQLIPQVLDAKRQMTRAAQRGQGAVPTAVVIASSLAGQVEAFAQTREPAARAIRWRADQPTLWDLPITWADADTAGPMGWKLT
jgi:hypothetical protein